MDVILASKNDLQQVIYETLRATLPALLKDSRPNPSGPKAWLTNREAMEFLGLSRATLQRYRASGKLSHSKVGANIFYRYEDVVALLEENIVG